MLDDVDLFLLCGVANYIFFTVFLHAVYLELELHGIPAVDFCYHSGLQNTAYGINLVPNVACRGSIWMLCTQSRHSCQRSARRLDG